MQVWLPESKYPDRSRIADFYQQTIERIRSVPGVESASAINFLSLSGWGDLTPFALEGYIAPRQSEGLIAEYRVIDPDYFRTMGIPLLQGRAFTEQDRDEAQGVVLINETMARRYWPHESPLGKRLQPAFPQTKTPWRPASRNTWLTIVGVVGDVKELSLMDEPQPEFYLPFRQNPSALMRLVIRSAAEPASLIPAIRHAVLAVDNNQPVTEIKSMRQWITESVFARRTNMFLLGLFASVALILAAVGIYGVMSYTVSQRTHEIGVRLALGAQSKDVLRLVVGQGMRLVLIGVLIGIAAASALMRLMSNWLYGVSATDPATFVVIALLLASIALLACYLPARRAIKVEPMVALRYE